MPPPFLPCLRGGKQGRELPRVCIFLSVFRRSTRGPVQGLSLPLYSCRRRVSLPRTYRTFHPRKTYRGLLYSPSSRSQERVSLRETLIFPLLVMENFALHRPRTLRLAEEIGPRAIISTTFSRSPTASSGIGLNPRLSASSPKRRCTRSQASSTCSCTRRSCRAVGQLQTSEAVSSAAAWDGWGPTSWICPQYLQAPVVIAIATPTIGARFATASSQSQRRVAAASAVRWVGKPPSRAPSRVTPHSRPQYLHFPMVKEPISSSSGAAAFSVAASPAGGSDGESPPSASSGASSVLFA